MNEQLLKQARLISRREKRVNPATARSIAQVYRALARSARRSQSAMPTTQPAATQVA